jgi:hypothetical protein
MTQPTTVDTTSQNVQAESTDSSSVSYVYDNRGFPINSLINLDASWVNDIESELPTKAHEIVSKGKMDLVYISITDTYLRLNEILGPNWSTEDVQVDLIPVSRRIKKYGSNNSETYVDCDYLDIVTKLYIVVKDVNNNVTTRRFGIGAASCPLNHEVDNRSSEMDDATKTSLAMAIRKAANAMGLGLYLWDTTKCNTIKREMKSDTTRVKGTNYRSATPDAGSANSTEQSKPKRNTVEIPTKFVERISKLKKALSLEESKTLHKHLIKAASENDPSEAIENLLARLEAGVEKRESSNDSKPEQESNS